MDIVVASKRFLDVNGKHQQLLQVANHIVLPMRGTTENEFEKDAVKKAKNADILIIDKMKVDAGLIKSASKLKIISVIGSNTDNIDVDCATERGVQVTFTPDTSYISRAELAMGLLFSLTRHIPSYAGGILAGNKKVFDNVELWGKILGLVGLDWTAKSLARRALGLGMRVVAHDSVRDKDFADRMKIKFLSVEELFNVCDFASVHFSSQKGTEKLLTAGQILKMKKPGYIVNVASNLLISEKDIVRALKEDKIAGYATSDPGEELKGAFELAHDGKLIVVPDAASDSEDVFARMAKMAVENVLRVLAKEKPHGVANKI